jgi:hypothetical protein
MFDAFETNRSGEISSLAVPTTNCIRFFVGY